MAIKRGPGRPKGSVNKPLKRQEISPIVAYYPIEKIAYYPIEKEMRIRFLSFDNAIKLAELVEKNI